MISLFCIPCLRWFDGTSRCLTSQTFFQMPQMFQWRCSSHKNLSDVFHHHLSIIFDNDVTMSINYQLSLIDGSLIIDETINYQRCPRIYLDHFFDARMEKKCWHPQEMILPWRPVDPLHIRWWIIGFLAMLKVFLTSNCWWSILTKYDINWVL